MAEKIVPLPVQYRLEILDALNDDDVDTFVESGFAEEASFEMNAEGLWEQTRLEADDADPPAIRTRSEGNTNARDAAGHASRVDPISMTPSQIGREADGELIGQDDACKRDGRPDPSARPVVAEQRSAERPAQERPPRRCGCRLG